jgi:hypothetical protein
MTPEQRERKNARDRERYAKSIGGAGPRCCINKVFWRICKAQFSGGTR